MNLTFAPKLSTWKIRISSRASLTIKGDYLWGISFFFTTLEREWLPDCLKCLDIGKTSCLNMLATNRFPRIFPQSIDTKPVAEGAGRRSLRVTTLDNFGTVSVSTTKEVDCCGLRAVWKHKKLSCLDSMLTAFSMSFRSFFVPRLTKFTTVDSARDIRETEETAAWFAACWF